MDLKHRHKKQKADTEFQQYYDKGHKIISMNYRQSLECFNKAKRNFSKDKDQFYRLIDLMIDQARIHRDRVKDFQKSKAILSEGLQQIKNNYKGISEDNCVHIERLEQQFKILSDFGQAYVAQADTINEDKASKYLQCIDKSIQYCSSTIKMTATFLKNDDNYRKYDEKDIIAWEQFYSEAIINSIDPLMSESQKFKDQENLLIYQLIFKISEKMGRFYELSHKSEKLKQQNARSWYYRAAMLRKTSKNYKQIEYFLKKDYDYCKKHNLKVDLQKTRQQCLKFYISREKFEEVKRYLITDEEKKIFNQTLQSDISKLRKLEQFLRSKQFINAPSSIQVQNFENYYYLLEDSQNSWFSRLPPLARQILPNLKNNNIDNRNSTILYLITHYTSKTYFQLFDEINALDYCQQSFKYCQSTNSSTHQSLIQYYNALFLKLQLSQSANKPANKINQIEKQLLALTENFNDNRQKYRQVTDHIRHRKFKENRVKFLERNLLESEEEKELFEFLKNKKIQNQMSMDIEQIEDIDKQDQCSRSLGFQISFMQTKNINNKNLLSNLKSNKQILQQKYTQLCAEKGVMIRNKIMQAIQNMEKQDQYIVINLQQFFDISVNQLQIYLDISRSQIWDFRNCRLNNTFLQKFMKKCKIKQLKSLKITNINKLILTQTMNGLMREFQQLEELHLENLDKKFIQKSNSSENIKLPIFLNIISKENIKILKLKNCRISDQILTQISQYFKQLSQLDLSRNQITGKNLGQLNNLQNLQKLNLSYNPINSFTDSQMNSKLLNPSIKKLKLKCLKRYQEGNPLQFPQITICSILDISQNNSNVARKILDDISLYCLEEQLRDLPFLTEIRLKKSNVVKQIWQQLVKILAFCPNFQLLDLRYSSYSQKDISNFNKYHDQCSKYFKVDDRAFRSQQYPNQFQSQK